MKRLGLCSLLIVSSFICKGVSTTAPGVTKPVASLKQLCIASYEHATKLQLEHALLHVPVDCLDHLLIVLALTHRSLSIDERIALLANTLKTRQLTPEYVQVIKFLTDFLTNHRDYFNDYWFTLAGGANCTILPTDMGAMAYTILLLAIFGRNLAGVRFLLRTGADPNFAPSPSLTPLTFAIDRLPEVAPALIDAGAKVQTDNPAGDSLRAALIKGNNELVQYLLMHGAQVNRVYSSNLDHGVDNTLLDYLYFIKSFDSHHPAVDRAIADLQKLGGKTAQELQQDLNGPAN